MYPNIIKNIDVVGGIFSSSYLDSTDTNHEEISPLSTQNISIEERLDFILSHLHEPIWPRTIFTKTLARQYVVYSREEALARFKQSNLLDCRINAYPNYTAYNGINRQPPNFIFIDIDRSLFTTDKEFWMAVNKTGKNIDQTLGGKPSILWSGNGVHICQPVESIVLEQESKFAQFDHPSQTFLRFAAQFLSNHKSDTNNNPAFKSCLLRIPGSYNSKYIEQDRGTAEVKVIQRWDGFRPRTNPLYYHFYIYLADKKLKEFNNMQKIKTESYRGNTIQWIEKLLGTPIDDYRKNAVNLILAPYLINVRKLSYDAALNIVNSWLCKCHRSRQLDQDFNYMVRYSLKYSAKNGNRPLKLDTLKLRNPVLHDLLK
jgi:Primase X